MPGTGNRELGTIHNAAVVKDMVYPVEVHRRADDRVVRITWSDDHVGEYPFAYLRGWCPCAGCQGHGGDKRYVHAGNTDLAAISVVGNYALQLRWGDGHETGIYTYRYLRELCPCEACSSAPEPAPS